MAPIDLNIVFSAYSLPSVEHFVEMFEERAAELKVVSSIQIPVSEAHREPVFCHLTKGESGLAALVTFRRTICLIKTQFCVLYCAKCAVFGAMLRPKFKESHDGW